MSRHRLADPKGAIVLSGMALLERVQDGLIGRDAVRTGPFGPRRVVYADYTASGRAVDLVEDVVRDEVLPWYANTHTESSTTGRRTTRRREEARAAIRDGVGGDDSTAIIFCGSGTTAAIDKLIGILGLRRTNPMCVRRSSVTLAAEHRPVVFVGPYEHHSNEIAWRESVADVVVIPLDERGGICASTLDAELIRFAHRPLRIGSFSAASNVTGVLSDTSTITRLLHRHGALACWDYAAAAPYVDIPMTTRRGADPLDTMDAVFLSPHKMVGGPGSPGVLAIRRDLLRNPVPVVPGGGTVRYVAPWAHDFLDDVEHREEGGTPDIVGSIRAGLAMRLKHAIGLDVIAVREERHLHRAMAVWSRCPELEVLGAPEAERLPIMSFRIRSPRGGYLHHNLVVAMLDDLFGIQARGGCSCAGPYAHRLLRLDVATSGRLREAIAAGRHDGVRPGWTRVGLSYVLTAAEVGLIVDGVALIARHGWRLLPHYRFDPVTGIWRHRDAVDDDGPTLDRLLLDRRPHQPEGDTPAPAALLAAAASVMDRSVVDPDGAEATVGPSFDALRWFDLPAVCVDSPELAAAR